MRRSVFIFLYEGEEPVVDWALEMYEKDQERDQIGIKEAEKVIWNFILNDQEGGRPFCASLRGRPMAPPLGLWRPERPARGTSCGYRASSWVLA